MLYNIEKSLPSFGGTEKVLTFASQLGNCLRFVFQV